MESIPTKTLAWRLYGAGLENFGNQDAPDNIDIRPLKDDEILTKVEAIGLCFSDIKIIRLGGNHLKLWEKDLKNHPLIIGHEAILTILKKGPGVPAEFEVGKRYLVQPDIYIKGRCCAYGYGMDGGLTQYSIIDHRVWRSEDGGSYLLECPENLPSASAALMEPWTCVRAAYHIPHRTTPVDGGALLLVTQPGNTKTYKLGKLYAGQSKVVALNFSDAAVAAFEKELGKPVVKATALPKDEIRRDAPLLRFGEDRERQLHGLRRVRDRRRARIQRHDNTRSHIARMVRVGGLRKRANREEHANNECRQCGNLANSNTQSHPAGDVNFHVYYFIIPTIVAHKLAPRRS